MVNVIKTAMEGILCDTGVKKNLHPGNDFWLAHAAALSRILASESHRLGHNDHNAVSSHRNVRRAK